MSKEETIIFYEEYRELYRKANDIEQFSHMRNFKDLEVEAVVSLDKTLPTGITSHAYHRAHTRIADLAKNSNTIYNSVFVDGSGELFIPHNTFLFISDLILQAKISGEFDIEGKNRCKYKIDIKDWCTPMEKVQLVAVVEDGSIITIFFNIR